ncbi:filamentous hemagglutinin N-terminal domain-containing protein [Candidatus Gracilibacteria bacterium]|nr:filamentous hemagglutinin N-terminal domain-containing protein [Candidatus Gracilibacteria bacterium]NJP22062.1 filamentous hemagglutinin N-terminal domain-containing protein [Hydrococcus sp. CRU_1_1]
MTIAKNGRSPWQLLNFLLILSVLDFLDSESLQAQILPDNTLDPSESSQIERVNATRDRITGGATRGSNLFHSFREFSIDEGRAAYFANPAAIRTIFSRVTGNNPSQIFGTLGVEGNANLFFINPNGIIFGPNATLDVRGSFIGSTANSIAFPNGENFSATNPNSPPLLTIDVPVPIGLVFEGSDRGIILNAADLRTGQNLTLVGGSAIAIGTLSAPNGEIALTTVPEKVSAEVQLGQRGQLLGQTLTRPTNLSHRDPPVPSLSEIVLDVGKETGLRSDRYGQVRLVGSNIAVNPEDIVLERTSLQAKTAKLSSSGNLTLIESQLSTTADMALLAKDSVRIQDSIARPFVAASGGNLLIQGNEQVNILALNHPESGLASGKDMILRSPNPVIGDARYWSGGNFRIETLNGKLGNLTSPKDPIIRTAGDVLINGYRGASLHILAGGKVEIPLGVIITGADSENGLVEQVSLSNGETVAVNGRTQPTLDIRAGVALDAIGTPFLEGDGSFFPPFEFPVTPSSADISIGQVIINAPNGQVLLTNQYSPNESLPGGDISVTQIRGDGSDVILDSRSNISFTNGLIETSLSADKAGDLTLVARDRISLANSLLFTSNSLLPSPSGNATIQARQLVLNGSQIVTDNYSRQDGGNLTINASESVRLFGIYSDGQSPSALFARTFGTGKAGDLTITTGQLLVRDEAFISTNTFGIGKGGNLTVNASDLVQLSNSDLTANTTKQGDSGNLSINTGQLILRDDANISTTTEGAGEGGDLIINADQSVQLLNSFLTAGTLGQGNSGNLTITTPQLVVRDRAGLFTTGGAGEGGDLTINADQSVQLIDSLLTAGTLGQGDSGNLSINTGQLIVRDGAQIFTTTVSAGEGGDLTINADQSVQLINSLLTAGTLGQGNSGNLSIKTGQLIVRDDARILTIGDAGEGGDLTINADQSVQLINSILTTSTTGKGKAGNLTITTPQLLLRDSSTISTLTGSEGAGGNLTVNAFDLVQLKNSRLTTGTAGKGNAGNLKIETEQLMLQERATIFTNTGSEGNAGNLTVDTSESVQLSNSSLTTRTTGKGNAGNLRIETEQLLVRDGASILTDSSSEGDGGNLIIKASESVRLLGISPDENISSNMTTGTTGKGKAGNLRIETEQLLVRDGASISTSTTDKGDGGNLTIKASESVRLFGSFTEGNSPSILTTGTTGKGNAGNLKIETGQLLVRDGAFISTLTSGEGKAGNLTIDATESFRAFGTSSDGKIVNQLSTGTLGKENAGNLTITTGQLLVRDGALISTLTNGEGKAGNLSLTARQLLIQGGARILTGTRGEGGGGKLTINATESVQLLGNASGRPSSLSSETVGTGRAGDLIVNTEKLLLRDGAEISTSTAGRARAGDLTINAEQVLVRDGVISTATLGNADAGSLIINATESVRVVGVASEGQNSTLLLTSTNGKGNAGDLTINTERLLVRDGAGITTITNHEGEGGNLTVNATESVQLLGGSPDSGLTSGLIGSGLATGTVGKGNAGNLNIHTQRLLIRDGTGVTASTSSEGNGGRLTVNASESVKIIGTSNDGRFSSFLTTNTERKGEAGDLNIDTKQLLLQGGARIAALTRGEGNGGTVTVNASESVQLSGIRPSDREPTTITAQTEGAGDAGRLNITTEKLLVEDGAAISVNSQGTGVGGQILVKTNSLFLDDGTISAETASTQGGDLTLNVQDLLLLRNGSQISTTAGTAEAGGDGGNIFIDAGSIVAIPQENSDITANAFLGDGGRVIINTESIFGIDFRQQLTPLSDITASSTAGTPGEVIINTSGIEPTRGLENLTEERINVEVAQGCRVGGTARGRISFYNVGRGGLPPSPDDLFNSPPTQEWLSLESQENRSSQPKTEPSFLQQPNNTVVPTLIFSCQVR